MANVFVNEDSLSDIADAIRSKLGVQTTYKPGEMAAAIEDISGGGGPSLGTKSITENGTYNASSDSLDGYSQVTVNVPQGSTPTGTKQISVTENGTITEDVANYASAEITVNVPTGGGSSMDSGTFTPESNGKTFSVTVTAGVTHFVFYETDFNAGIDGAGGWITVGGIWFNSVGKSFCRYNNANDTSSGLTVSVTGTTLTFTAQYNLRTEKTYKWYAW